MYELSCRLLLCLCAAIACLLPVATLADPSLPTGVCVVRQPTVAAPPDPKLLHGWVCGVGGCYVERPLPHGCTERYLCFPNGKTHPYPSAYASRLCRALGF